MRVLQFVSTLNRNSGVMRVIMNYYTNMNRQHVQFDFLYFIESEDSYADEIHAMGGKTYYIPKPGISLKTWHALVCFFQHHGASYQWLHNHENYLTVFLYPLAKIYGIENIAVHAHLTRYSDKKLSALRNRILCLPLKFLPIQKVACSKAAADFLYGSSRNVYIMRNMVDARQYAYDETKRFEIRHRLNIADEIFVIGHVGRFELQKNHRFLIELFEQFHQTTSDSKLLLVGAGALEQEIKDLVLEKKLEQAVIFVGQQTNIADYLSAMDGFVLPSLFEGLPMVALEAQANGLTCVLTDTITKDTAVTSNVWFYSLNNRNEWLNKLKNIKKNLLFERSVLGENTKILNLKKQTKHLEEFYEHKNIET